MATAKPKAQPVEPAPKKSSAWKQGLNKPKTNWASKSAVNRPRTQRATQFKIG
jgi:hypothetical protein